MHQIWEDKFAPGDIVKVKGGEVCGCKGIIEGPQTTYRTELGIVFGYPLMLSGAANRRVAAENELEKV